MLFSKQFGYLGSTELLGSINLSFFKLRKFSAIMCSKFSFLPYSHIHLYFHPHPPSPQDFSYTLDFLTLFSMFWKPFSVFFTILFFPDYILCINVASCSLTLCHTILIPLFSLSSEFFTLHIVFKFLEFLFHSFLLLKCPVSLIIGTFSFTSQNLIIIAILKPNSSV